jgi:hypothetical protein
MAVWSRRDGLSSPLRNKSVGDPDNYTYWTLSVKKDGTPFADNVISEDENPGQTSENSLIVFPSPTTGIVTIQFTGEEEMNELRLLLIDVTGRLVSRFSTGNPGMLDLSRSGLPDGLYFLMIDSQKNSHRIPVVLAK